MVKARGEKAQYLSQWFRSGEGEKGQVVSQLHFLLFFDLMVAHAAPFLEG